MVLSKIREEEKGNVMEAFEFLINQKIMKGYSGYYDAKIIETLAKIPVNERLDIITISLSLLLNENYKCHQYESLIEINLRIIESIAEIPATERLNVVYHTHCICNGEVDSRSLVIRPADQAPQIRMPSYARSIIICSIAKVKRDERDDLIKMVSKFQIKKHGDCYTALIINEIASMPASKRTDSLI